MIMLIHSHAHSHSLILTFNRSHVCWHVYGLIYRSERNYSEAVKAYKQALRIDPQNIQILRDLSLLQIQIRDLTGFAQTKHTILELKPNQKTNWLGFALSKHLNGQIEEAINVIDIYLDTLKQDCEANGGNIHDNSEFQSNYESSELALYKNMLICEKLELQQEKEEMQNISWMDYKEPYDHLLSVEHLIKDKYSFLQSKARYQLYMGQFNDAKNTYLELFDTFGATEDYNIHSGYMCCILKLDSQKIYSFHSLLEQYSSKKLLHGARSLPSIVPLTNEQKDTLYQEYVYNLTKLYPKSHAIRRMPLTLLHHESDEWKARIESYIQRQLIRGVPSLGSDIASLFLVENEIHTATSSGADRDSVFNSYYVIAKDPSDILSNPIYTFCSNLIDGYITSLESQSKFPKEISDTNNSDNGNKDIQPPSTLLWTWYLRAELYDLTGQYEEGINLTTKCLNQTPTAVDIYELQGKLYDHAGDIEKAVSATNEGRLLDKQDRYINNQTVKYLLRAGNEKEALETMALFTRHESDPEKNIKDMQCYWYEMELGKCLKKKGELGKALKKFSKYFPRIQFLYISLKSNLYFFPIFVSFFTVDIEKHFEDFNEDQFDFHSYCIRKVTLRSYIQTLRWEDSLYGHDVYADTAEQIIQIYMGLFDNPPKPETNDDDEPDYSEMTPAERKKAKAQARKKKMKAKKKAESESEDSSAAAASVSSSQAKKGKEKDEDGKELLKLDPLEQANKYMSTLVINAPARLSTWLMQYDLAIRRKKLFIALKSLKKAKKIENCFDNGDIFTRMVEFGRLKVDPYDNADLQKVFETERSALFDGKDVDAFISSAVSKAKDLSMSLSMRVAVAKAVTSGSPNHNKDACDIITCRGFDIRGVSLDSCFASIEYLKSLDISNVDENLMTARDEWIRLSKSRFYLTNLF